MKYDFTSIMDRHGKDAIAVDGLSKDGKGAPAAPKDGFDAIPMWVADMNFPTAPSITAELEKRIQHPAYGYFKPTDEYFNSIINWQKERNGVQGLEKKHIGYENGVLGGVISALNVICSRGDNVLLHSPTYIGFTGCLTNAGYHIVHSPLYRDKDGIWRMDYEDMAKKIEENHIHAAIFCSPHNPCGRVWTKEEIEKAMQVYADHDVWVISDEIWSDLILEGYHHTPTQSVNEWARQHVAAFYAPSKTFNLAGLIGSYHIIYNDWLREREAKEASLCHYNSMNVLSMHALIGAYKPEGQEWLDELRQVLTGNVSYAVDFIEKNFPGISVARPEGTYMLFLDCTEYCKAHGIDVGEVLHRGWDVGVEWQDGRPFHGEYGIRVNLALPLSRVQEAFGRLQKYVFTK